MIKTILSALFLFVYLPVSAQTDSLRARINGILLSKKATVGIAIASADGRDTLIVNGSRRFPMQSVFKFHIGLAILSQVDKGKLSFDRKILVRKKDLLPDTWSPMREKYPRGNVRLSLAEILRYTVSESDNNGCDILLRLAGGPKAVEKRLREAGVKDLEIRVNEAAMHRDWEAQFRNWTKPSAAVETLRLFNEGKILSKTSTDFLLGLMIESPTGMQRLKGLLPARTVVAHKTGSSGTNDKGVSAATNDIGIILLPDQRIFYISVFVSDSRESSETNERIIAEIAKAAWDHFQAKK